MLNTLFQAHSGLRYLVLLLGVVALVVYGLGFAQKKPFTKAARIVGSVFVSLADVMVLIGVAMVAMGLYSPKVIGHIVMMLAAIAVAHITFSRNRKQPTPGYKLPLIGVTTALLLIVGGIFAIGRSPLASTVLH